ncbi:MAG: 50S ribosomal protein L13 [Candidatus Pacearchaeota archaeon]
MEEEIIIDATNSPLGRIASFAAKKALLGNKVIIVNTEKAIITGKKESVLEEYLKKRRKGGDIQKGPFFPSNVEKIMKRTIRGMLPYKQYRGREALKKIKCYESVPKGLENKEKISLENKKEKGITLLQLTKLLKGKNE